MLFSVVHNKYLNRTIRVLYNKAMAAKRGCIVCDSFFISQQPRAKYCSDTCRNENYAKIYGRTSDASVSSGTVGAILEMMVASYLMETGYSVFRALSPACMCDLIIFKDGVSRRIEVRTAYKAENGRISFPLNPRDKDRQDIFAAYVRAEGKAYFFDANRNKVYL